MTIIDPELTSKRFRAEILSREEAGVKYMYEAIDGTPTDRYAMRGGYAPTVGSLILSEDGELTLYDNEADALQRAQAFIDERKKELGNGQ